MLRKIILLLTFSTFINSYNYAQNRSEYYDLLHTQLHLNLSPKVPNYIEGVAFLTFFSVVHSDSFAIDLEGFQIDSIKLNYIKLNFSRQGHTVKFKNTNIAVGDTFSVEVFYKGVPAKDPSGWGGFYFSGNYAFNLGVGFQVNPHTYGRAWYPAIDEFTERSTFKFIIDTDTGFVAMCNGLQESESDLPGNKKRFIWNMNEPIPSYLASVAVAPYKQLKGVAKVSSADVPFIVACEAADTAKALSSFSTLTNCIGGFDSLYGPHTFSRVGFNLVPFNSGAMEHATNIAFPRSAADGTLSRETLMAHELSHHWWGNTVTCATAEDMWINEGWARFSEALYLEFVYGRESYNKYILDNHFKVLKSTHITDKSPMAISGVPHQYTYGSHVYDKGASVVHSLRGVMGDSSFFKAIGALMAQKRFQNISSAQLRDFFQNYTSANLTSFFENWVFEPGFAHVELRRLHKNGTDLHLALLNRSRFTEKLYANLPLDITVYSGFQSFTTTVLVSDWEQNITIKLPESWLNHTIDWVVLDEKNKLCDAVTEFQTIVKSTGTINQTENVLMTISVNENTDSSLLRIEHHWVAPFSYGNAIQYPFPSNYRYWKVDGVWNEGFSVSANVSYDGRTPPTGTNGYLDHTFIKKTEDSLVLLYRSHPDSAWVICVDCVKNQGNPLDKAGTFTIPTLKKGEYALGMYDYSLSIGKPTENKASLPLVMVAPNPSQTKTTFYFNPASTGDSMVITNNNGKKITSVKLMEQQTSHTINFLDLKLTPGTYYGVFYFKGFTDYVSVKFVVN